MTKAALTKDILATRPLTSWGVRSPAPPSEAFRLAKELSIPPLLASVLWSRGLRAGELSSLNPPLKLSPIPALSEAAARLEHALKRNKRILIHGDYDADGISGTAVLMLGLRALGGRVSTFIPNRLSDGYGVSPQRVSEHIERADLFITVDCGVSNLAEIRTLQDAGVEVIVTDHHHPGQELPDCLIVHPAMSEHVKQGLPALTGAGVAYHLLWALHQRLGLEPPLEYSDLATIGTIADVAPLLGENRALIQLGLERLSDSQWPGLRATLARTLSARKPTARDVAFVLAPRLNAAGRLGEAELGLELLTTASERRARELAAYLDLRNGERRKIQDEMFEVALTRADPAAPALVLDDPDWHPGVMGIVASKLLEQFYKPVFIIAKGKGSVRSTPGISAVEGLNFAQAHLLRFGGHSQAAGFAILEQNIDAFRHSIYDYVRQFPEPQPQIMADALLSAADIDKSLFEAIDKLEPFGEGHPSPQFALSDTVEMARAVGQSGKTLQLRLGGIKGVAWQQGDRAQQFAPGTVLNAAISLRENEWQGRRNLEFIAEELRQAKPLSYAGAKIAEAAAGIYRGKPDQQEDISLYDGQSSQDWQAVKTHLHLRAIPLAEDNPLELCQPLHVLVSSGIRLNFDLSAAALMELRQVLEQFPTLLDLRYAFVALQRGQPLPFNGTKGKLGLQALQELKLLDQRGRPLAGQKRDPYQSATLLRGLLERYKLSTFINAYQHLDDHSFAVAVNTMFGKQTEIAV